MWSLEDGGTRKPSDMANSLKEGVAKQGKGDLPGSTNIMTSEIKPLCRLVLSVDTIRQHPVFDS